jgi:hypothetical protein
MGIGLNLEIMAKFGIPLILSEKFERPKLIKHIYSQAGEVSSLEEMHTILNYNHRTRGPMLLESFAIYAANKGYLSNLSPESLEEETTVALFSDVASAQDDLIDEILFPYWKSKENLTPTDIENFRTDKKCLEIISTSSPFYNEYSKIWIKPSHLFSSSNKLSNFAERNLEKWNKKAFEVYKGGREKIEAVQASHVYAEILLKNKNMEALLNFLSKHEDGIRFLERLSIMGGKAAEIYNFLSCKRENIEEINEALGDLFSSLTGTLQLFYDDAGNLAADTEKLNGNAVLFYTIKHLDKLELEAVKSYLKDNPKVMREIWKKTGYEEKIKEALKRLEEEKFPTRDFKLALRYTFKKSLKGIKKMEEDFGIQLEKGLFEEW